MPKAPPLLPLEALGRVLRHGRVNGTWVLIIGTFFALLGAINGEMTGMLAWLIIAASGAICLHGTGLLQRGEPRGLNWLVGGELFSMGFILALCAWQLTHVDLTELRRAVTADMRASYEQAGLSEEEFLLLSYRMVYVFLSFFALSYPGGLALYFHRRRQAVHVALTAE